MFRTLQGWRRAVSLAILTSYLASLTGCTMVETAPMGTTPIELVTHPAMNGPQSEPILDANGQVVGQTNLPESSPPSELAKVSLPEYRLAPPDILLIQGIRAVPKSPYTIQTNDFLTIVVTNALPEAPIAGPFQVSSSGFVNLGGTYGSVKLEGLTEAEAINAISTKLSGFLVQPQVALSVVQASGIQPIFGEHIIAPDGTVNLGVYGTVYVSGMTVNEARVALEKHLSQFLDQPKVSVDVVVYNSKHYYVITQGAGFGDQLNKLPITGNETVLDAIANVGGLQQVSSKKIWIARPAPKGMACDQILPIDWFAITRGASTGTNYQILPGDRIYIAEDRLVAANSFVSKVINPVERMLGFSLLGAQSIQYMQRFPRGSFSF
ncbi:MAG: polysaccharide biosynthesis/export family protein [Planctomycetales bacterium]|nr:polysaccharide biosynthesis/export family protein [Planctomycetales bacterium]